MEFRRSGRRLWLDGRGRTRTWRLAGAGRTPADWPLIASGRLRLFSGANSSPLPPASHGPARRNGWGWRVWGAVALVAVWVGGGLAAPHLNPLPQVPDVPAEPAA